MALLSSKLYLCLRMAICNRAKGLHLVGAVRMKNAASVAFSAFSFARSDFVHFNGHSSINNLPSVSAFNYAVLHNLLQISNVVYESPCKSHFE